MMEFSIAEQTLAFMQACALGVLIGFLYDLLRSVRIFTGAKFILTALCDVIFDILLIITLFLFFVNSTDGIIRFYIFAGVILGGCLYFLSISAIFVNFVLFMLRNLMKWIDFIIKLPLKAKNIIKNKKI